MSTASLPKGLGRGREELPRRSQTFSLSYAFRSPSKRGSVLESSEVQPTCQEKIHYPVFNPRDPRHNPAAAGEAWRRSDSQTSSSDSQPSRQIHWVQDFPRRSLHKARSGLLALRAGLLRRSTRQDSDLVVPVVDMSSNQGHNHQETYGFSSTTQEDLSFGFELYRARRNHPRASNETNSEELNRVPSFQPLENAVSAPERLPSSCTTIHGPEDAELPIVSMTSHEASALDLTLTRATSPGPSLDLEDRTDNGQLVVSRARNITTVDSVHSATSIDWETVGSSGSSSISTSTDEDIGGTSLLCDAHGLGLELQNGTLEGFAGSAYDQHSSRSRLSSASSDISSSDMKQDEENSPKGSFALPDYDTASIAGSNASNRQPFIFTQSEAFVTQERLDQAREASYSSPSAIPLPHSRQCSAEVGIAFPGIYQELLDQWTREAQGNLENYAHGGQHRAHRPSQLPIISLTPETPFVREAARASSSTALLWSYENLASLGAPAPFGTSQFVYRAFVPPSSFISPLSLTEDMQDSGNVPYTMLNPPGHSDSASQPHSNRSSDARHSFGLHISLRNESDQRRTLERAISPQEHQQGSFDQHNPLRSSHSLSSLGVWGAEDSQCDYSEVSTNSTRHNTTSDGVTSRTSMSTAPWSPLDSPIDEEVLFSHHRSEYWSGDGKHSSYYPDRGDQPVKVTRPVFGDGHIYSGPGLDRTPSSRLREATQMMPARAIPRQFRPDTRAQTERGESESTG